MRGERSARGLVGLVAALSACTVGLDFSPGALQPSLDGGARDVSTGVDSGADVIANADACDGRCACAAGRGDCDGLAANGCETDLATSDAHCGACGVACAGATHCTDGVCRMGGCRAPLIACGMQCADLLSDGRHCGACGLACGPGAPRCCNGACAPRCP